MFGNGIRMAAQGLAVPETEKRPEASGRFRWPPQGCTAVLVAVYPSPDPAVYLERTHRSSCAILARLSVWTIMSKIRTGTRLHLREGAFVGASTDPDA